VIREIVLQHKAEKERFVLQAEKICLARIYTVCSKIFR
jgi:hypothetical protein